MSRMEDARIHLDEAMRLLTLEAYRVGPGFEMPEEDFTIAEELERIDRAIGPSGESMFARLGDRVRSAYVEIKAARQAIDPSPDSGSQKGGEG